MAVNVKRQISMHIQDENMLVRYECVLCFVLDRHAGYVYSSQDNSPQEEITTYPERHYSDTELTSLNTEGLAE